MYSVLNRAKVGEFWMHEKFRDVFFQVLEVEKDGLLVRWWNWGQDGNPYCMHVDQFIRPENHTGWYPVNDVLEAISESQS